MVGFGIKAAGTQHLIHRAVSMWPTPLNLIELRVNQRLAWLSNAPEKELSWRCGMAMAGRANGHHPGPPMETSLGPGLEGRSFRDFWRKAQTDWAGFIPVPTPEVGNSSASATDDQISEADWKGAIMPEKAKSIEEMDEDMKGLDHNGMLQRQWKMLKQVLEKNAETNGEGDGSDSPDTAENGSD